jgi:hypothetical protein
MAVQDQDPDEVLENFPPNLLGCKGEQHVWPRDPLWVLVAPGVLERQQVCRFCKLFRYLEVDQYTGARLTPTFQYRQYPKGYITGGSGLVKADFQKRLNQESIAKALKAGKVHGAPDPQLEEKRQAKTATSADAGSGKSSAAAPAAGSAG